ncbi:MAG: putative zinc-binding metallopeptidase [Rhodocyclaceae bacterium]
MASVDIAAEAPMPARAYRCVCGQPIYFPNSQCLNCGRALGVEPCSGHVHPLEPMDDTGWRLADEPDTARSYRRCANLNTPAGCNWLVEPEFADTGGTSDGLCLACRLNRVIPDLSHGDNGLLWGKLEQAKRRLVSQLIALRLPIASKVEQDPERGLCFDFLRSPEGGPAVMTGHADGVITINVHEADDVERERLRTVLHEPYRTLLGHLRHEVGHYYWDRLIAASPWLDEFRALFGDERRDYAEALKTNYEVGPPPDWALNYVSAYASTHPWEDWAETWAHYLHMLDSSATAASFGLDARYLDLQLAEFTAADIGEPDTKAAEPFLRLVNRWLRLTGVLNEMSRSMGQPDFYPFALPAAATRKLYFIHRVVLRAPQESTPCPPAAQQDGDAVADIAVTIEAA